MKLSLVIDQLIEERGLSRDILSAIICEGMLAAYSKKYPDLTFKVEHDPKTDDVVVLIQKVVVAASGDDEAEISIRKARAFNKDLATGDVVWVPFEGSIGRVDVLRAKQVIAGKIRQIESSAVYNEFKDKEGTIVYGVVHKCERFGTVVILQDTNAFLPKSLSISTDRCVVGHTIRALLKDVLPEPKNESQLILDRVSDSFLQKLFELEIPEVFEKLVEIKNIVRAPGYKSKIVVLSNDSNIDPVGTCVGVGGVRIKPILKELGGEKIDVIAWSDNIETLIKNALKPAQVNKVKVMDNNEAHVWLDDDQRSLAIGKMGQNISLASRLVGMNIVLIKSDNPSLVSFDLDSIDDVNDNDDLD
ncbi:MAG TPA: transcription termination factor NusA [Candidatus Babeliales bacterium]|nr:transcription termination factor NusA [Candidatus Babeliales bacterium]